MSIEEQAAALIANGLATSTRGPQLNVVSTFAAFFEGIAREGLDMWQYQRNLTGVNEGLNVTYHLSHVGACTGRDHFSGWGLDWVNVGLNYLPYLHRFYAPSDARVAFLLRGHDPRGITTPTAGVRSICCVNRANSRHALIKTKTRMQQFTME